MNRTEFWCPNCRAWRPGRAQGEGRVSCRRCGSLIRDPGSALLPGSQRVVDGDGNPVAPAPEATSNSAGAGAEDLRAVLTGVREALGIDHPVEATELPKLAAEALGRARAEGRAEGARSPARRAASDVSGRPQVPVDNMIGMDRE